jgi:aminopeptidase N
MDNKLKMLKKYIPIILLPFMISCSMIGIHMKVENPKKPGEYPKEKLQWKLLSNTSALRTCYDVYNNNLSIEVNPTKKYLVGENTIKAKLLVDTDSIQIDLYKNMKINAILSGNVPLTYHRLEGAVFIKLTEQMKTSREIEITIKYEGSPIKAKRPPWVGGFVWKKDKNKLPWIGVACESEGASLWWPCKDDVSDEADSTLISITVPSSLTAVSNGKLKSIQTNSNQTSTFKWNVTYPINNYNVTLYVGDFKLLHDEYKSDIAGRTLDLNHYVLSYNYDKAEKHFGQVKKHIAFYEKMFGEYPWYNDGFKLVESPFAGMEHQSAIAYGNGYKNDQEGFDYIILHETAHEWWGNSVTASDLGDGWIHEGFASYCEALYVESTMNYDNYLNYMHWQRITIQNKRPVVRQRNIRYFNYKDGDIYSKGSWVLHSLRTVINNDSLFFDILKTFRIENHQKQILSEVFIDLVNKKTGKDYNWFFKQYLFKREAPILEYYRDGQYLYYRWTKTDADFVLPVKFTFNNKSIPLSPTAITQRIEMKNLDSFYDNSDLLYYGTKENKNLKSIFEK